MCSVVILRRPGHAWPVILGANRDEMVTRPWRPPGRHWADRPNVVAGQDELAGGTWSGLNDEGVYAAILNRENTLGPEAGKRSRGELVLEALDHADARDAAQALAALEARSYRPFNLVIADNRDAFWLTHKGEATGWRVVATPIPDGLSMVTGFDMNDETASARTRDFRPLFRQASAPDPDKGDFDRWAELLACRIWDASAGPRGAMCVATETGFETVSSSLVALPAMDRAGVKPVWHFAPGRPDHTPYRPVDLA